MAYPEESRQTQLHDRGERERGRQLALADNERKLVAFDPSGLPAGVEEDDDVINLREYWQVIRRRKWTVIYFFLLTTIVSVIATFIMTPIYRSTLVLQIEREAAKVVEYQDVTPEEGGNARDFYQTQYELLQSRTLARRVISELGLERNPSFIGNREGSFFTGLSDSIKGQISGKRDKDDGHPPDYDKLFLDNLTVSPVRNSRLVHVHFDSTNARLAANVVNSLAKNFVNSTLERRFDASSYAKNFLTDRIKQVRADLEDSERALAAYAREREIIDVDQKQGFLMQKIGDLNKELVAAEDERFGAEAEHNAMQRTHGLGHIRMLEDPVIQHYKGILANLEATYQENLRVFKPAYPTMVKLEGQIKEIKSKIGEEIGHVRAAVASKFKAAVEKEARIQAKMADLTNEILELQNTSTDYQVLKRDVDTNRKLYDGLLQRMKEVGVAAGIGTNNISIVDPGEVPRLPHKPSLQKNLLLAIVFGLFGGIGLAFLFEHLDDSIKSAKDLESRLGLAVLGIVPEVRNYSEKADSVALLTHEDPKSSAAEAYRSLRTALSFSTSSGTPRLLHFTSAVAGEGKTTTAISTAIAFTQIGKVVLVIDADLRNPSLHKELGLTNEAGLTNYLAGDHSPAQVVQKSNVKGLWSITTGPIPPNPAELLSSGKMLDLLEQGEERFDLVVLDSPPVLGLADSLILANMSRTTVLVVDSGVTRQGTITDAMKRLRGAQANILGAVLTKQGQGGSGYEYNYNYYNYEGSETTARLKLTKS